MADDDVLRERLDMLATEWLARANDVSRYVPAERSAYRESVRMLREAMESKPDEPPRYCMTDGCTRELYECHRDAAIFDCPEHLTDIQRVAMAEYLLRVWPLTAEDREYLWGLTLGLGLLLLDSIQRPLTALDPALLNPVSDAYARALARMRERTHLPLEVAPLGRAPAMDPGVAAATREREQQFAESD